MWWKFATADEWESIDERPELLLPEWETTLPDFYSGRRWNVAWQKSRMPYYNKHHSYKLIQRPYIDDSIETVPDGYNTNWYLHKNMARMQPSEYNPKRLLPEFVPHDGYTKDFPLTESEPEYIYRGISDDEMKSIMETGEIRSKGEYNLGERQIGKTYFGSDPSTANSYAGSFAPYNFQPSFDHPSYVIKVRRPANAEINPHAGHEVEVEGAIPASEIVDIIEVRPYAMEEGYIELNPQQTTINGQMYGQGSGHFTTPRNAYKSLGSFDDLMARLQEQP